MIDEAGDTRCGNAVQCVRCKTDYCECSINHTNDGPLCDKCLEKMKAEDEA